MFGSANHDDWLDPKHPAGPELPRVCPVERPTIPVSTRVNDVRNDDATLIEPV